MEKFGYEESHYHGVEGYEDTNTNHLGSVSPYPKVVTDFSYPPLNGQNDTCDAKWSYQEFEKAYHNLVEKALLRQQGEL